MQLGGYEVLSEIGRGGVGVVLRARGPSGEVAIKLLHRAGSEAALARFAREERLLASLGEAEGFVPLLDRGSSPQGPFLVMPFVPGGTLRDRLRRGKLPIEETIALGAALARALGAAHGRGIVHRDMKPENVLYTAGGRPLVADLGLAKHFDRGAPGASASVSLSRGGEFRGTLGYMALEQMRDAQKAGPPADVFALGAILHECLTGELPYPGPNALVICELVEKGELPPLRRSRPEAPRWLAAIVEKALARDAADRFPDASALARALEAPRAGRGRALALLGGALLLALGAGGLALGLRDRGRAAPGGPRGGGAATASASGGAGSPGSIAPPGPTPPGPTPPGPTPPLPAGDLPELARKIAPTSRTRLLWASGRYEWSHADNVSSVAFSPDGRRVASGSSDRTARLWDASSGRELAVLAHPDTVLAVALSPDGTSLLAGCESGGLALWDLGPPGSPPAPRRAAAFLAHAGEVETVAFSSDGALALTGSRDLTVKLWDLTRARRGEAALVRSLGGFRDTVTAVAFAPDGGRALSSSWDGKLRLWDLASGEEIQSLDAHAGGALACAFSPDGKQALSSGVDRTAKLWDLASGKALRVLGDHGGSVPAVAFSRDGRSAFTGSADRAIRAWDLATGAVTRTLEGHTRTVKALALSPDGLRLASGGTDQTLRLWELASGRELSAAEVHRGMLRAVTPSPDGKLVLTGGFDQTWRVLDAGTGRELARVPGHKATVTGVVLSRDGGRVLTGSQDRTARLWDLGRVLAGEPPRPLVVLEHPAEVRGVALLADGVHSLSGCGDGGLRLWDLLSGSELRTIGAGKRGTGCALALLADPERVLVARGEPRMRLLDVGAAVGGREPVELARLDGPGDEDVIALAASSDGRRAISGGRRGTLCVWDLESRTLRRSLSVLEEPLWTLALSPDGALALAGGDDQKVHLLDLETGDELDVVDLGPSADRARALSFTADGRGFLVGTGRGVALRFAIVPGKP